MPKFLKWLIGKFWCFVGDHDWTCNAKEGIPPTKWEVENGVAGFKSYAQMWCKRCKKYSDLSL